MPQPTAPKPRKLPKTITQLGRTRTDDYVWMKDDNWQAVLRDPTVVRGDIKAALIEENAYREAMMASTGPLQEQLFAEMKGRLKPDDASPPARDGDYAYFTRYQPGAQHPQYCRRLSAYPDADVDVLLDADAASKGKAYFKVGAAGHNPQHSLFAYAVDEQGSEVYRIVLRDTALMIDLNHAVESTTGDFCFSPDGDHLFWVHRDEHGRSDKVYRRPLVGGSDEDELVYDEPDEGFFLSVSLTQDRSHVAIHTGNHETSECWIIPGQNPQSPPVVFAPREAGVQYDIDRWQGRWMIRTNADGAVDFKIAAAPDGATGREHWRDEVAHTPGRLVAGMHALKDHFVLLVRENAANRIVVRRRPVAPLGPSTPSGSPSPISMGEDETIAFDEPAFALSLSGGYEFDTTVLRLTYESPTTPRQWFDYDLASHARSLVKTQEIPSGHDPGRYETRRLFAKAADGAEIPITVLMKRGVALDGRAPLLLYGYGSYGMAMEASFSIQRLSLVDRGWIWAIAHVRGGSEKGWGWFLDGRGFSKKNTFTDFIACAEHLHASGYGAADKTVAYGGSAGGMLMGAINNMRPDLFAGVMAAVPFVDVLNTMSDTSLPLTPPEWPEWGNPLEDAAAYDYIASYSPYDNVGPLPYPAILATGGLSDPRVTWWEPQKWTARLREHATGGAPVLLKIDMEAGHGGASGRFDYLKDVAHDYAFAIWAVARGWERDFG